MKQLGELVLGITIFFLSILSSGFVLMKLWNWFPATLFEIDIIPYWGAVGLTVLVSFTRFKTAKKDIDWEETVWFTIGLIITDWIVYLPIGWIIHQIMI